MQSAIQRTLASVASTVQDASKKMTSAILLSERLGGIPWKTFDPFLFCAYHNDHYPKSAGSGGKYEDMGIEPKLLRGRDIGSDFSGKDGFSMYHGEVVPGFPSHPHYGFETVTVARHGRIDHFDSHGATARYGDGDAQWLTAGAGIQHSEMFPMVNAETDNHAELFQLWLNLPQAKKKSKPFFSMAWANEQPKASYGEPGKQAHLRLVGGNLLGLKGVPPPPDSYASDPKSEVIIATLKMDPGSKFKLPAASAGDINRAIYFFTGSGIAIESKQFKEKVTMVKLQADREVEITALDGEPTELLLLQGRPINEPVVQYGPFVTNSREELMQVNVNFRKTEFGGWKWGRHDPVHPREEKRFFMIDGKRVDAPEDSVVAEEKEQEQVVGGDACKVKKSAKYSTIEAAQ